MSTPNKFPPPSRPSRPPPPPVKPPPPPHVHPPPPSPDKGPTVIVIVFISLGGVFFLAFLAAALFCFLKRKKKKKKTVQETDMIHVDEHKKIKEQVGEGPHGKVETVVLSIEDDIHVDEVIKKNETETFGKGFDAKSADAIEVSGGLSSTGSDHHHHHHLEHKA